MRNHIIAIYVVAAFVIGCVASQAVMPLVVPPIRAGTNPQKWEYSCFSERDVDEVTKKSNEMGAQGWELASSMGAASAPMVAAWCFKRPLP